MTQHAERGRRNPGTTVTGATAAAMAPDTPELGAPASPIEHDQIEQLAYSYWEARGCPDGSPEEDWFRAERDLQQKAAAAV